MDGDGQNDPRDIPRLLESSPRPAAKGPALVGGVRTNRKAEGSKRWASRAANWIRDAVLKDNCPDTGCGIKVYWREAFLRLPFFTSMHRYLPALFLTYGHEVAYVPVNDRAARRRQVEVQQFRPGAGRPLRSVRRHLAAQAHEGAGDRRGSAGGPAGLRPREPLRGAATRRSAPLATRTDLSAAMSDLDRYQRARRGGCWSSHWRWPAWCWCSISRR